MKELAFDPFESYYTHHIIRHHLTVKSANYFRLKNDDIYREKRRLATWEAAKSAGLRSMFTTFTRRFRNPQDMRQMLLSTMVTRSPNIGWDLLYDLDIYQRWVGRVHAMHVHFEDDLLKIRRRAGSVRNSLKAEKDAHPALYTMLMAGEISMETFAWIVEFAPAVLTEMDKYFDPKLDLAWKEKRMVGLKYPAFLTRLNINQERLKTILRGYVAK